MPSRPRGSRVVAVTLGAAMLAVVLAATVSPYLATGSAQTSCAYPPCPPAPTPSWVYALIAVVVIVTALALAFIFMRRRRRRPPAAGRGVRAWEGGAGPGAFGPMAPPGPPRAYPPPEDAPVFLETPEETEPILPAVEQGAAGATGAAAAEEPDTAAESVRAELERISQEIHRRAKAKRPPPESPETDDESRQ